MSKWTLDGLADLDSAFDSVLSSMDGDLSQGIREAAEFLLDMSRPLVPIRTGQLIASGHVEDDGDFSKYVVYEATDPNSGYDYAPIQHEELSFNHTYGQAKYLEEPYFNFMEDMISIVADNVQKGIK